jgi:hypothetical protein
LENGRIIATTPGAALVSNISGGSTQSYRIFVLPDVEGEFADYVQVLRALGVVKGSEKGKKQFFPFLCLQTYKIRAQSILLGILK